MQCNGHSWLQIISLGGGIIGDNANGEDGSDERIIGDNSGCGERMLAKESDGDGDGVGDGDGDGDGDSAGCKAYAKD